MGPGDLTDYVAWLEGAPKASAKTSLWAVTYYYEYSGDEEMRALAGALRSERIKRRPLTLGSFRGVEQEVVDRLAAAGIRNVDQMLKAGRTSADRESLSLRTGVPLDTVVELVQLSDLARLPGVKGIRARLYRDAGVDSIEEMTKWDPEELRTMLLEFVERTGFEGVAPLPAEAAFSVSRAKELPRVVEW